MKRYNNLYNKIISIENLKLADYIARKGIKKNFIKMIKYSPNQKSKASYNGWMVHCNSINLQEKYL